jgi:dTDP-4-dehydrorhamnose reductase
MITGAKGQLGADCERVFRKRHEVRAVARDEMDITDVSNVDSRIKQFLPDVIINCAAYTKVDKCETDRDAAWKVNVAGAENLAGGAEKYGSRLIHVSTDYVFDGRKSVPEPYVEIDETNPVSYYGMTKLEGEKAVKRAVGRFIIVRTAWLYGLSSQNFLKTMLRLALKNPNGKVKVVNDQFGSPTWTYRLALQIADLVETNITGIVHATAEGHCTWFELADYFLKKMDVPHTVIPCTTSEYPTPAVRPMNSILDNRKLKDKGMNIMAHWKADVDEFVFNFRKVLIKESEKET